LRGLVNEHARRQGGLSHPVTLMTRSSWESRWHSETSASGIIRGPFEAIIIDQNPSLETRAEDTPRLSTTLSETGVMLFDDWRPKHEGRIRRAFQKAKGDWIIGDGGDGVRRFPKDKTIGWARRAR
jgi:hypothetical protein